MARRYGARVYNLGEVIIVKQTVKKDGVYIIDGSDKELHVSTDEEIANAVRMALMGRMVNYKEAKLKRQASAVGLTKAGRALRKAFIGKMR